MLLVLRGRQLPDSLYLWKTPEAGLRQRSDRLHGLLTGTEVDRDPRRLTATSARGPGGGPALPRIRRWRRPAAEHRRTPASPRRGVRRRRRSFPPSAARSSPHARPAARLDGRRLPRIARRCCSSRRSGGWTRSRPRSSGSGASRTSRRSSTARSTGRSCFGRSGSRRPSRSPTRSSPSRSRTTRPGSPRRGPARASCSPSCSRCGRATSSGSSRGRLILARSGFLNWLLATSDPGRCSRQLNWAVWLTFVYLWLPFVDPSDLRGPRTGSRLVLEASSDLGAQGMDDVSPSHLAAGRCPASWRGRSSRSR